MAEIDTPEWARKLMDEIASIKTLLQQMQSCGNRGDEGIDRWDYYDFVNRFRRRMQPDPDSGYFPEVRVGERRIGVTFDGLLYDKESGETLSRPDAFETYKTLYRHYRKEVSKR